MREDAANRYMVVITPRGKGQILNLEYPVTEIENVFFGRRDMVSVMAISTRGEQPI